MTKKKKKPILYLLLLLFLLNINGAVIAQPSGGGSSSPTQPSQVVKSPFTDVTAGDSNLIFISYLAQRGLMKGFPDGGFHPGEGLTRAEAAALLARTSGLNTAVNQPSQFKDVSSQHWAAGSIAAAVKAGYIKGFPDATFQPEKKLTRAEGISLFLRLSPEKASVSLPALQDMNSQQWAAGSVAVALDAGMIGLSQDGKKFYPDQPFKRGDLARALSILLTKEPNLSKTSLYVSLKVKNGTVKVNRANGKEESITSTGTLEAGDSINTASGEAELGFPDGSGLLLKSDTQLAIKESRGRSYITADGTPGNGIDYLEVELKQGKLFGALASKYDTGNIQPSADQKKTGSIIKNLSKVASLKDLGALLFADNTQSQPWYKTAEQKKVKVKVDMPWGIAAIRGSFWSNMVTNVGNTTTLLEGSAEVTSSGQTQPLSPMQTTAVTAANTAPTAPVTMTAAESKEWVDNKTWVETKAQEIVTKQEAAPPLPAAVDAPTTAAVQPTTPIATPVAPSVPSVVSSALSQATSAAGGSSTASVSASTSTSGGSGSSSYTRAWTVADVVSTVYNGTTYKLASDFNVTPPGGISASYFSLRLRDSNGITYGASEWKPVGQTMRRPTLFFSDPSRVVVKFATDSAGQHPTGLYSLNSDGSLCNLMKTVQGTITLPTSYKAPAGGLQVRVIAKGVSGRGRNYEYSTEVTIPEGTCSVDYKLKVLGVLPDSSDYQIGFEPVGTYSEPWMERQPVGISCANLTTAPINCEIFRGVWASGSIQLPAALSGGQTLAVTINYDCQSAIGGHPIFSQDLTFDSGSCTVDYKLPVAPNDYKVYYVLHPTSDLYDYFVNNRLLDCAYYRSGASSTAFDGDTLTMASADVTGIDLNVPNNGCLVTGSALIPWEAHEDVYLYVSSPSLLNYMGWGKIPKGMVSADYTLVVPAGSYSGPIYFNAAGGLLEGQLSIGTLSADLPGQNVYLTRTSTAVVTNDEINPLQAGAIEANSIWIGSTVFNLDSPDYTVDKLVKALAISDNWNAKDPASFGKLNLYYKSSLPAWFDLNNSAIGDGSGMSNSANAIDPSTLPVLSGGYYPGKEGVGICSRRYDYFEQVGTHETYFFALTPPDASFTAKNNTSNTNVKLTVNPKLYEWPQPMVGCQVDADSPGTASVTITATTAASGYTSSSVDKTINVTAIPNLDTTPYALDVGYPATTVTIYDNASNLWNAGDALNVVLIGSEGPYAEIGSQCTVNDDNITLTLPAGQPECRFNISLAHAGASVPFANARIYINQAGNNSVINPGSCYNKSTNILTIPVSGNEPYAPIDPTKLTITTNDGLHSYTLAGTYSGISNAETLAAGKVQHNSNCCFEIWLTSIDVANMSHFDAGPAKITAVDGWCIDASGNHANVPASPVSIAITN